MNLIKHIIYWTQKVHKTYQACLTMNSNRCGNPIKRVSQWTWSNRCGNLIKHMSQWTWSNRCGNPIKHVSQLTWSNRCGNPIKHILNCTYAGNPAKHVTQNSTGVGTLSVMSYTEFSKCKNPAKHMLHWMQLVWEPYHAHLALKCTMQDPCSALTTVSPSLFAVH